MHSAHFGLNAITSLQACLLHNCATPRPQASAMERQCLGKDEAHREPIATFADWSQRSP